MSTKKHNNHILNLMGAIADAANKLDDKFDVISAGLFDGSFVVGFANDGGNGGKDISITIEPTGSVSIRERESVHAVANATLTTYDVERVTTAVSRWVDGLRYGYSNKRLMEAFGSVEATVITPPAPEPIDDNQPSEDVTF